MKIFIGADHRGFKLKERIVRFLKKKGHRVIDVGTYQDTVSSDYPEISYKVARRVTMTKGSRGILICMTGIGNTIAANKVPGAYAALCYNHRAAVLSREHNDTNILVLGAKFVSPRNFQKIIQTWLTTKFQGGRHLRRVKQIKRIERKHCKGSTKYQ